jgi:hypothetical protein
MNALNGAAGGERRRDLERDLVQRVVPRRDRRRHACRLAHHEGISDLFLKNKLFQNAGIVREVRDRQAGLDAARHLERHADFLRDGARELVGARLQTRRDLFQEFRAFLHRSVAPCVERRARGFDRRVGIRRVAGRNASHDLAVAGIVDVDRFATVRRDPAAADEKFVLREHRVSSDEQIFYPAILRR